MDFLAIVKETGPFSTPLAIAALYALRWMNARLEAAEARERAAIESRSAIQLESIRALTDASGLITRALETTDDKVDAVSEKIDKLAIGSKQ